MIEEFQTLDLFPLSVYRVLLNLAVSLICGIIIALIYRFIYKGPSYSPTYVNSLILLAMITSLVILVIGNNLARAFGLVGAMSIIRFRTAVRDVQDIVFIFFALTVGMASGVGLHAVAFGGTLAIGLVAIILVTFNFANPFKADYVLQLIIASEPGKQDEINKLLKKFCNRIKIVNIKNQGEKDKLEVFYQLSIRRKYTSNTLANELTQHPSVIKVNLYSDQEGEDTIL